jgi:hypothetical protein
MRRENAFRIIMNCIGLYSLLIVTGILSGAFG